MAFKLADHLKTPQAELTAEDALRAPVDALLGVSAAAKSALANLHIVTVFDLAAAQLFATATTLLKAETDPTLAETRLNVAAADAVTPPPGVPVGEWARRGLELLAGLTPAQATDLGAALNATTIRDLALWPPYLAARAILQETFALPAPGGDPEAPADLRPTSGSYATERVFFRKLVIDLAQAAGPGATPLEQLTGLDLDAALAAPAAFQRIATGALLTFKQSWFSQGVTLGQLLHSMSLAPGETTRIAVVDWLRQSRSSATESIDEREQLTNEQTHIRALNEVTASTATEVQAGSSTTSTTSSTGQTGASLGVEIGPLALGGSHGSSSSTTEVMSTSSSFGARDLAASLSQSINDRTQQHASSARSRRASAVREVSQNEHESISTRVVTNYNHMHALTLQYYEVVQAYRVTTELARAERCLFVPLRLLDFSNAATVDRLRPTLAEVALTPAAFRQLTSEYGAVEVVPQTPRVTFGTVGLADVFTTAFLATPAASTGAAVREATAAVPAVAMRRLDVAGDVAIAGAGTSDAPAAAAVPIAAAIRFDRAPAGTTTAVAAVKGWDLAQINLVGALTGRTPLRSGSDSVFLPSDARLLGVGLRDGQAARFAVRRRNNAELPVRTSTATSLELATPALLTDVLTVHVQNAQDRDFRTTLALSISLDGTVVTVDVPVRLRSNAAVAGLQELVRFGAPGPSPELVQHLTANRLHYSQAIFARLDEAAIAALLARFTYKGLPLQRVVDARPVATTSNFLVFRVNVPLEGALEDDRFAAERREFAAFLKERGLDRPAPQSEIVPLPSEGVFAEAVLGRFNSAEKIDLGRFWNWQDSPIQITAPDIAPIAAGSRAEAETLRPGQLGAPVVSIQAPTALPAAAGVGPMLSALQAANLFRDMSGMEQTAALAKAAVAASGAGATAAGDQAAQNLKTVMEQHTQRMKIAADMLGAVMNPAGAAAGAAGGGGGSGAGGGTVSERGAALNEAQKLDAMKSDPSATPSGTAGGGGAGTGAPPTLQEETLRRQTGSDVTQAAETVVENATKPVTTPKTTPRPKSGGGSGGSGGGTAPAPTAPAPVKTPVKYRMTISFSFSAVGAGLRRVVVSHQESKAVIEIGDATSPLGADLVVNFETAQPGVYIDLSTFMLTGTTLTARKFVDVPRPFLFLPGTTPEMEMRLESRPSTKTSTFTIGTTGIFQPDTADLEQQLQAKGITPDKRIGDPTFELQAPDKFKASVRWFTGALIVTQRL